MVAAIFITCTQSFSNNKHKGNLLGGQSAHRCTCGQHLHVRIETQGAIHSTKNFRKFNGSVRSNRKSFEKTGPPFEVDLFSRSDRSEFWLNGSRPQSSARLPKGKSHITQGHYSRGRKQLESGFAGNIVVNIED